MAEAARRHERRHLSFSFDREGFFVIHGRLSPEDGAAVAAALEEIKLDFGPTAGNASLPASIPTPPDHPPGDADDFWGASRADALVEMAREPPRPAGSPRRPRTTPLG
ncbi:MAG: hypothetical protein ACRDJ4_02015 [Actinomycetota bacterium]